MLPPTARTRVGLGAAVALLFAGAALAPILGPLVALPAALAAAGAVLALALRARLAAPAAGVVSLLATVAVRLRGAQPLSGTSSVVLLEVGSLLLLVVLAVRAGQGRAAVPAGVAASCWFLRFGPPGMTALPAVGFWAVIALLAAAGGGYLRSLDQARARSVAEARRSQRLELARDLHDFVAHDVSEMLALAQAGRYVTEADGPAAEMFGRIEHAALQALAAMDRTVHMLHDEPPTPDRKPLPTLADLPELAERFAAAQGAAVRLDVDPQLAQRLPREISATAYRVAVESLTNVRRHAPGTGAVHLTVRRAAGPALEIAVSNEAGGTPAVRERSSGLGLVQLAERVEALGGTLTAGPLTPGGWRTSAVLPLNG
ncbi:histidine kinase [Kitasatospora sp. GP82]|uniref:sensor histidine kinase n=1 Tax=Kitasatospora sp. GP82 TaxID=3035089 RepID=UPI002475FECD|nr:histidine kinase [Kitasatospora sp. GP82]MDH6127475.1 signal transduction histidine kinase [Kitasatospora sp. GP82]